MHTEHELKAKIDELERKLQLFEMAANEIKYFADEAVSRAKKQIENSKNPNQLDIGLAEQAEIYQSVISTNFRFCMPKTDV